MKNLLYERSKNCVNRVQKSVTGLDYYAWERGPVPKDLFEELGSMRPDLKNAVKIISHEGGFQEIRPRKAFDGEFFTKREMRLLEETSCIFKEVLLYTAHLPKVPQS